MREHSLLTETWAQELGEVGDLFLPLVLELLLLFLDSAFSRPDALLIREESVVAELGRIWHLVPP